jgi:hypothetical protein
MAITVTTDLTTISAAESTTDSGTWYRLNGTSSANPAADGDAYIQGTFCIANKMGADSGTTNIGGHFNSTATFDLTGKHLYHWRQIVTAGNMLSKANRGITIGLTNTSTTSTTAWSTTNYKQWFLDGSDTIKSAIGWTNYVIDPSSTADVSAGTLTLTTVKNIGFICRQTSGVTTTVSNQFVDAVRAGTGVTATASSSGDTISFNSIYSTDSSVSNSWGIITQQAGIYYGVGKFTIGATGQTNTCLFKDTDAVLVFRQQLVATTFYEIKGLGAASFNTTIQLGNKDGSGNTSSGCIVRAQGTAVWTLTCDANTAFKAYSSSIASMRAATLSATSELKNTSIANSGTIDVNGATITSCIFSGQTATQLKVDTTAELSVITDSSFTSGGTGHAIEITVAGTYDFDTLTFNGFASSNGSTGNEAVYINVASGNVTLNINGGNTPSYRTAGATVTVVAGSVTVTLKAQTVDGTPIQDANVFLAAASGGPFPYHVVVTISNSGTTATVTHTSHGLSTNDKIIIENASLSANNGVFTATVTNANTYTYTMGSAPGSSPTGTILSTFVILKGLTNVSGELSMSRVFPSNQPVAGWARKSSSAPYYKTGPVSGTINSSTGAQFSALLTPDQ